MDFNYSWKVNITWWYSLVDVAHGLGEPCTLVSLVYALDVFCDFMFSCCLLSIFLLNKVDNSGGVWYDGSKYKSSLFNVYDL